MSRIDILLATYNGARFLPEQLASLSAQSHTDWRLLVRDDGSSDNSLAIVREWARGISQPVEIIEDGRTGLGASLNFATLLEASDAPYFACCDQDDVWLPEKLSIMLKAVRSAEEAAQAGESVLAFSDLEVVDGALEPLAASFWKMSKLATDPDELTIDRLMLRNVATGCAILGNAPLRDTALPIPPGARMHDWWLMMVAAGLGICVPVPMATVRYRQHGGNVVGASSSGALALLSRFARDPRAALNKTMAARDNSQRQAAAFADRYRDRLDTTEICLVREYGAIARRGWWQRKTFLIRHRLGLGSPIFFFALLAVI